MNDTEAVLKRLEQSKSMDTLNLSNLQLKVLPSQISLLTNLKYLYLDNNKLIFVPEIGNLSQLEELSMENNELTLIPEAYYNFKNLKSLNLSKNHFKCLSSSLFLNFQYMTILWLNHCELMFLPKEIGCLKYLEKLGLKENNLQDLPDELGQLANLKWLNLEKNEIYKLPDSFSNLKYLNHLNLAFNKFEQIPDFLYEFKNLNILSIRNNSIRTFSDENILGLSFVNKVDLRDNQFLKTLKANKPDFYAQLTTLSNFIIETNESL